MAKREREPTHPGHLLQEEFMKPLGLTQYRLAKALQVSAIRISQILRGKRAISADTALRLGYFLDMDPLFWMHLQNTYDLEMARRASIHKDIKPLAKKKGGKASPKIVDFSDILQEGLDRFFMHFEPDQKLRK